MLDQLTRTLRRLTGLHGDALGNAATSMRANRRAREHREAVEVDVRDAVEGDARETQPTSAGRSPRR